ncbi:Hypothetical predicted protein [Paramuricea clavata]|uniref:Uncharacterized protein n=1 Tax=Paramuricea clavata TaxID=317549 RepID=A0A6S7GD20_PARCT|nr:Hypothetical predicted protein [Paramuricea clavata]
MNEQWKQAGVCTDNVSKDKMNFIRLSCVLHVLLSAVLHYIDNPKDETEMREPCAINNEIPASTLKIAQKVLEPISLANTTTESNPNDLIASFGKWFIANCSPSSNDEVSMI